MWDDSPQIRALRKQVPIQGWPLLLAYVVFTLGMMSPPPSGSSLLVIKTIVFLIGMYLFALATKRFWHKDLSCRLYRSLPVSASQLGLLRWKLSIRWPALLLLIALSPWALGLSWEFPWNLWHAWLLIFLALSICIRQIPLVWNIAIPWAQKRGPLFQLVFWHIGKIIKSHDGDGGILLLANLIAIRLILDGSRFMPSRYMVEAGLMEPPSYLPWLVGTCMVAALVTTSFTYRYSHMAGMNHTVSILVPPRYHSGIWDVLRRITTGTSSTLAQALLKGLFTFGVLAIGSLLLLRFTYNISMNINKITTFLILIHISNAMAPLVAAYTSKTLDHIRILKTLPMKNDVRFLRMLLFHNIPSVGLAPILSACIFLPFWQVIFVTTVATLSAGLSLRMIAARLNRGGSFDMDIGWLIIFFGVALLLPLRFWVRHVVYDGVIFVLALVLLYGIVIYCYGAVKHPQCFPRKKEGGPA